jgi:hypothetical protein
MTALTPNLWATMHVIQCPCSFFSSGLDDCILPYAHFFLNNNVIGQGLLNLTVDDLNKLRVEKLGHQEIILEALELLRNLVRTLTNCRYIVLCFCVRVSLITVSDRTVHTFEVKSRV